MLKSNVEAIIRKSSFAVMVISGLLAVFSILAAVWGYPRNKGDYSKDIMNMYLENKISSYLSAAVLIVAAFIFFRIFRSGRPFTNGNIWAVRSIAGLFIIRGLVPLAVETLSGNLQPSLPRLLFNGIGVFFMAVLMLFFAEIMRYGKLLQIESDETL